MATTHFHFGRLDADQWLKNLGLDPYLLGAIKALALGEKFWIGCMSAPTSMLANIGLISASIQRTDAGYKFEGVWNAKLDGKDRLNLWVEGLFVIQEGVVVFPTCWDSESAEAFQLICRRIHWIVKRHAAYGQTAVIDQDWLIHTLWHCQITKANRRTRFGCLGPDAEYPLRMVTRPGSSRRFVPSQAERIAA